MPIHNSPPPRITRAMSRQVPTESNSEGEGDIHLMEIGTGENSSIEMQELRAQLAAVTASATKERQERERLEKLINQYKLAEIIGVSVTSESVDQHASATTFIPTASSTANTTTTNVTTVSRPAILTAPTATMCSATTASTISSISTAAPFNGPSTSSRFALTQQKSLASYSWPRISAQQVQHNQPQSTNEIHPITHNLGSVEGIPSFLPPLHTLQTIDPQVYQSQLPILQPTQYIQQTSSIGHGKYKKLHDLPEFHGRPEEWPMFCMAFLESTNAFNYTNVDNMFRLQKSLKGSAREVVESLLIHPNNIDQVMATLEFRFGRPECLVQSQLKKIREIRPIAEDRLELLIPFATKVQNLTVFLEASGMYQHMANPTLMDELVSKLPMSKRLDWAQNSICIQPFATIKHFNDWLSRIARLVCVVTTNSLPSPIQSRGDPKSKHGSVLHATESLSSAADTSNKCRHCDGKPHKIVECSSFHNLNTTAKWDFLKRNKLCFSCLKYGHAMRACRLRRSCGINGCNRRHHPLLHEAESKSASDQETDDKGEIEVQESVINCIKDGDTKILFRVLPVRVYNGDRVVRTFALLDEGSSVTIMSSDLSTRLKLDGRAKDLNLRWFGQKTLATKSFVVDILISADEVDAERFEMREVHTVSDLCLPIQTFTPGEANLLSDMGIPLVGYSNARPEILIGLDNSDLGAPLDQVRSSRNGPIVARTKLGWVVYGKSGLQEADEQQRVIGLCDRRFEDRDKYLDQIVEDYFCIENFGVKLPKEKPISDDDKRALEVLSTTTVRVSDRFQTGLLWKEDDINLPDSYPLAKSRLLSLESRMQRDPCYASKYREIIASYVERGYARKLSGPEAKMITPKTWYLPHFAVKNPNKPGKLRLVFDAAAEVNGRSLNSFLLKGPDDYRPLINILFNFRMRRVAVRGDIREMFHQVLIRPEDQHSQRFLWREDRRGPIDTYVMEAMTFGATCSPCSANYVKNLNASKFLRDSPRAVEAIVNNHYVDDYVDSFDSVAEAIKVTGDVISIHRQGGFELRNFISNSKDLLRGIPAALEENHLGSMVNMNIDGAPISEKVLGMCWDSLEDVFIFRLNFARVDPEIMMRDRCPTKREFLSIAMSIYDPFGMIANYALHLKLLLRTIWSHGVEWDDQIPETVFEKWAQWRLELPTLTQLKVPRCHNYYLSSASRIDLHTFVDASEQAFSAVTYLRIELDEGVFLSFVCGKTRGAPKKLLSMPRLELSAAVLGIRLRNSIIDCHNLPITRHVFWTDSKTVLHWLRSDPRRHKEFVAFRIAEILESSRINQWRWVPSQQNPADEGTRARYPPHFDVKNNWINGPSFLQLNEEEWPALPNDIATYESQEEIRSKHVLLVNSTMEGAFDVRRFSTFLKLLRTMAWVRRFINASRGNPVNRGELLPDELNGAELLICLEIQRNVFADEIDTLRQKLPISKKSSILGLTPYLDEAGLLRVRGRIDAATTIPFTARRPIILPKNHAVTKLIINGYHCRFRHQNDDTVVNEIRQKFWVPSLRSAVRQARKECQLCKIRSAKPIPPLMGQLPEDRLTPFVRAFTYTGLDYFGPISVTIGRRKEKRWVALFTCLTIRAVHLEIAADMSTDACLLCIRNFVNRRGVPLRIRSDNGTNFVGAKKELTSCGIFDDETIKAELSSAGIEWVFNCPANPHGGGCWERLVRSIKRVLSSTLCEISPKPETLQSALIEAENIVNSRPLTHLPVTTQDEEPLTPNHFLLGAPNSTQTPGPVEDRALCLRKQWRISQQLKNRFWKRWIREYLPVLTKRCKWFREAPPLRIGDLVLVCDVDVPWSQWIRGKIVAVFPGADGQVRTAEVATASGIFRRPAVKLAVLDVGEVPFQTRSPHGGWDVEQNM